MFWGQSWPSWAHLVPKKVPKITPKMVQKVAQNLSKKTLKIMPKMLFLDPKMELKFAPNSVLCGVLATKDPRKLQMASKRLRKGPKKIPDGFQMALRRSQEGSRWPPDGSTWPQEGSRRPQDGLKTAPRQPMTAQNRPKTAQDRPKTMSRQSKPAPNGIAFVSLLQKFSFWINILVRAVLAALPLD